MADSTRTQPSSAVPRACGADLLLGAIAPDVALWSTRLAGADGDPASDVLVSQRCSCPRRRVSPCASRAQLAALLSAARHSGYRSGSRSSRADDLGSITELWRQPASYARFLGQELSLVYRGTLLVVMPNGFGLYGPAAAVAAQRDALPAGAAGSPGPQLGDAAISGVRRLAQAAGHPLGIGAISTRSAASTTDYWALIALALGVVLILLAWIASVRARPLGSGTHPAP